MPAPATLNAPPGTPTLVFVVGKVGAIFATNDPQTLANGTGGGIQIEGNWYAPPLPTTAAMLTVAADARREHTGVAIHYWSPGNSINDITTQ